MISEHRMRVTRGYYGIGIYKPKNSVNIGTLWRSAFLLDASFIFTIGQRYKKQPTDTYCSERHVPLYEYNSFEEFLSNRPKHSLLIGVELTEDSTLADTFKHPHNAIYILGAEDHGLPQNILDKCNHVIKLRGDRSMNVSTAGSIIMYLRGIRGGQSSNNGKEL